MMIAGATSCKAPEKVTYFQDIQNQEIIRTAKAQEFTIQPGNRLSIIVKSSDPEVSALFNLPIYSTRVGAGAYRAGSMGPINYSSVGNDGIAVYNVDPEGKIDFPLLGQLKVGGMTNTELAGFIKGELMGRELVKDPTVSVSILGNAVNILGEIRSPGRLRCFITIAMHSVHLSIILCRKSKNFSRDYGMDWLRYSRAWANGSQIDSRKHGTELLPYFQQLEHGLAKDGPI